MREARTAPAWTFLHEWTFLHDTFDSWENPRNAKDPVNLVFRNELGDLAEATDAVARTLRFGSTRLAGDQWFQFDAPDGSVVHRHDVSIASGRSVLDFGKRLHVRLFSSGLTHPREGVLTAGAIHKDAPTMRCGLPNEVASTFDVARDYAAKCFLDAGYPVVRCGGIPRSFRQCDGSYTATDGSYIVIG
jgi:hypothetical protein